MSCIRVERVTEYLADPLRQSLHDSDPYVRKTAAIAVAKMYDTNPQLVEDQGFVFVLYLFFSPAFSPFLSSAETSFTTRALITVSKHKRSLNSCISVYSFLDDLKKMLEDSNPMVIANAVAALADISARATTPVLRLDAGTLHKLFLAVNECTEWGQVCVLWQKKNTRSKAY